MRKRVLIALAVCLLLALSAPVVWADGGGFDDVGYNRKANIFNGIAWDWCIDKVGNVTWCEDYLDVYANDRLLMKWSEDWDRGNLEGWSNGPYDAWLSNEWNGARGGSGSIWHYHFVWVGPCGPDYTPLENGGYCMWGQFAVISDHGIDPNIGPGHIIFALANPAGYGAYP